MGETFLPLFPLDVVLFPGMVLPLHVFEERYKIMIEKCISDGDEFGVVLIYSGVEVEGMAVPNPVGTEARIIGIEQQEDDTIDLLIVGGRRFNIMDYPNTGLPYLVGQVEFWEDESPRTSNVDSLVEEAKSKFLDYMMLIMSLSDRAIASSQLHLSDDATQLSYHIAANLYIDNVEKQMLLERASADSRLQHELMLLRREGAFLERLISLQGQVGDEDDEDDEDLPWSSLYFMN